MISHFLISHFGLSPASSVTYRRRRVIKIKYHFAAGVIVLFLGRDIILETMPKQSAVLSLETIQTLPGVFSLERRPRELQRERRDEERHRVGGWRKTEIDEGIKGGGGVEGGGSDERKQERESRRFHCSPTECWAHNLQSISDSEVGWSAFDWFTVNDTHRQPWKGYTPKEEKKSIGLHLQGSRAAMVALLPLPS